LVLDVVSALSKSGLAPNRLELEITETETVLMQDTDPTIAVLNQLRDLGVRIAMDDFGTGYFQRIPPPQAALFGDRFAKKHVALRLALRSVDAGRSSERG
jgi:hypothetical protein